MGASFALFAYAAIASAVAGLALRGAWTTRSPRLAIYAWQATVVSISASLIGGVVAFTCPMSPSQGRISAVLATCVAALRSGLGTPLGTAACGFGIAAVSILVGRAAWCAIKSVRHASRVRGSQRDMVSLAGDWQQRGFTVVPHTREAVYCIPGRRGRVVVTSAALASLTNPQLDAALAHERAHLRGRHHLVLLGMEVMRRTFPFLPLFRLAADEVARLVELSADDQALTTSDRFALATALAQLASARTPVGALSAGGGGALARVQRLLAPSQSPLPGWQIGGIALLASLAAVTPLVAAPVILGMTSAGFCPISL